MLALKTLGVSDEILQQIYGVDIATTIEAALKRGDDSKIPYQLTDPYECDPVDMEAMRELLMTATSSRFRHESLQATWELTNKIHTLVWRDGDPYYEPEQSWHVRTCPERDRWSEELRGLFLSQTSNLELLVLLPLPSDQANAGKWHLLRSEEIEEGQIGAMRLLAGLSVLGLSHRQNLTRTAFLSNLVKDCESLFEEVAACRSPEDDQPSDTRLKQQTEAGTDGLLLFRQQTPGPPVARPLVINFSRAWCDDPNRFTTWSLHDRTGDADEMADALLHPFTLASGVCLRLSLPIRQKPKKVGRKAETRVVLEHKVRLIAPEPWIDFLSQGHGGKRGKSVFAPHQNLNDPDAQVWCIDAPTPAKYRWNSNGYPKDQKRTSDVIKAAHQPTDKDDDGVSRKPRRQWKGWCVMLPKE